MDLRGVGSQDVKLPHQQIGATDALQGRAIVGLRAAVGVGFVDLSTGVGADSQREAPGCCGAARPGEPGAVGTAGARSQRRVVEQFECGDDPVAVAIEQFEAFAPGLVERPAAAIARQPVGGDGLARLQWALGRQRQSVDDQVDVRNQLDRQRRGKAVVVSVAVGDCRVGVADDDQLVVADEVDRNVEIGPGHVAGASVQRAGVVDLGDLALLVVVR